MIDEPFTALAFKLQTDPFVGALTFFRVYAGTVAAGSYIYNANTGSKEARWPYRASSGRQA